MTSKEKVRKIQQAAEEKRLVLFIGAGVSNNSGYRGWVKLVDLFASQLNCKKDQYSSDELLRIPQMFYNEKEDKSEYFQIIQNEYKDRENMENPILDELLKLEPQHIITTNYDHLIEFALERNHVYGEEQEGQISKYAVITEDSDLVKLNKSHVLLKMHGDVDKPESLVLKEDDYLQYSSSHILTETFIKSLLINHTFLFVGYGMNDYNLKLIMAWVDDIIEKYRGKVSRKEHFFLYANIKNLSEPEKNYYKKKSVQTLEFSDFTKKEQEGDTAGLTNEIGKKLYRIVCQLSSRDYDWSVERIYDQLLCFSDCPAVTLYDIVKCLKLPDFLLSQAEESLYDREYFPKLIDLLIKENPKRDKKKTAYIQEVFRKAGIYSVLAEDEDEKEIRIPIPEHESKEKQNALELWENAMKFDFVAMEQGLACFGDFQEGEFQDGNFQEGKGKDKSKAENGRLSLQKATGFFLIGKEEQAREYLTQAKEQCKKEDDVIGSGICAMNYFKIEMGAGWEFTKIWNSLSLQKRKSIPTLLEYADRLTGLKGKVNALLLETVRKFNPYSNTITHNFTLSNRKIRGIRAELRSICRYLLENGVFFYTIGNNSHNTSEWEEIVDSYMELLIHYLSPNARRRIEGSRELILEPFDFFLMLQFADADRLEKKLLGYRIDKLPMTKEAEDYLCKAAKNMVHTMEHFEHLQKWPDYKRITNFAEMLVVISERVEWSGSTEIEILTAIGKFYQFCFKEINSHKFTILNETIRKLQQYLYQKGFESKENAELYEKLSYFLIEEYFQMEEVGAETNTYVAVIEEMNSIAHFSSILEEQYQIPLKYEKTDAFFEKLYEKYGNNLSLFYYENFSIWSPVVKEEIRKLAEKRIRYMKPAEIYWVYSEKILEKSETKLLKQIHTFFAKEPETGVHGISIYYVIATLYRKNMLKDVSQFAQYQGKDWWFDFICFPEKFDYSRFHTAGCLWLLEEPYYSIWQKNPVQKEQIKAVLEQAMTEGPTEEVKRVYYRLFG